ncbi:FxsA family protein [Campylobacter sp. 9BO]|uniref:FxsA family protein n=1 Tax=Campylobacter sp. 9BO TaxID=3424759 RepID=UPI003D357AC8
MLRALPLPYLLIEFVFAYFFVSAYGFGAFLLEIFISGIVGIVCIFQVGFLNFRSNFSRLKPSDIFSSFGLGIAGFLLILPGILCDIVGAILAVISLFARLKGTKDNSFYYENFNSNRSEASKNEGEIIDVEVVSESSSLR